MSPAQPTRYLVDGYNIIRRLPRFREVEQQRGLEAGREALLGLLRASALLQKGATRVTVVFDGTGVGMPTEPSGHPRIRIQFSSGPQTADEKILAMLARTDSADTAVVTSDHDLAWEARKRGAQVVDPQEWIHRLSPPVRKSRADSSISTGKPSPTRRDVEWGLAVFGEREIQIMDRPKPRKSPSRSGETPEEAEKIKSRRRSRHLKRTRRR